MASQRDSWASRKKQMVFAFYNNAGLVYQHYAPIGTKANARYLVRILCKFLKVFKRKCPDMAAGDWILHWDNSPLHTAQETFLDSRGIRTLPHLPYSPDLAPTDFFLFPTVKSALSGVTIDGQSIKNHWERVERWVHRHEKCEWLQGGYVEKN